MKIGAIIRAYHLNDYLKPVIEQFDWVDRCLVVNALYKDYLPAPDNTEKIVRGMTQSNLEILKLSNLEEHDVLNEAIEHLEDCDRIYICDSDEFFDPDDIKKILDLGEYDFGMCHIQDFYDGHKLDKRDHHPICIVKPSVNFIDKRCAEGQGKLFNVEMKHLLIKNSWKTENYQIFLPKEHYLRSINERRRNCIK